jgi:DNA-binding transcriptional LysR family regulator
MNLLHLKYVVEVAKTTSISKAAENLFMGQPNLSRAIKELEENLGIKIFKRTSKGITLTPQGEEFLGYAQSILAQVNSVENMYKKEKPISQSFSISVPRASYIACAFTDFMKNLNAAKSMEILYKETNALRAIKNILEANYRLGIIRYQSTYDRYFKEMLTEKGFHFELICTFEYVALVSKNSPLASCETFRSEDLAPLIEIAHGDPFVPSLSVGEVKKGELSEYVDKHIFIFERGSQFDLLEGLPNTFMWASPVPEFLLDKYNLVMRKCSTDHKKYKDILIYKKDYRLSNLDRRFIDELMKYKRSLN